MFNQEIFNNNTCYISGLHRSGKSLLTAIIPSIENSGLINKEPLLNLLPNLYMNKEISLEAAKYLAIYTQSNINYSNYIGRKINIKRTDETSIYNHLNFKKYLKKINSKNKLKVRFNVKEKEISFYDIHNILNSLKFWTQTNDNFKLINIDRNPIDLAFSWYTNKLGSFTKSPINQLLLYEFKNELIPTYAYKWKSKYIKLSEIDRIIEILHQQIITSEKNFLSYKKKKNILRIRYENLLEYPLENLNLINKFLNLKSKINFSKYKNKVIKKKLLISEERKKKLRLIESLCSKTYFDKLINLEKKYNK